MVKEENVRSEHKLLENPAPSVQRGRFITKCFFRCQVKYVHVCLDFVFPRAEHYGYTYRRSKFAPEEAFVAISGGASGNVKVSSMVSSGLLTSLHVSVY